MKTNLADIGLRPIVLQNLMAHGYIYAEDVAEAPIAQVLKIPNMSGRSWRKITKAVEIAGENRERNQALEP